MRLCSTNKHIQKMHILHAINCSLDFFENDVIIAAQQKYYQIAQTFISSTISFLYRSHQRPFSPSEDCLPLTSSSQIGYCFTLQKSCKYRGRSNSGCSKANWHPHVILIMICKPNKMYNVAFSPSAWP